MGRVKAMPTRCSGTSKMAVMEWFGLEGRADGSFFISNHLGTSVPKASLAAPGSSPPPTLSCGCYLHRFLPREVQELDVTRLVSVLLPCSHRELSQRTTPRSRSWWGRRFCQDLAKTRNPFQDLNQLTCAGNPDPRPHTAMGLDRATQQPCLCLHSTARQPPSLDFSAPPACPRL